MTAAPLVVYPLVRFGKRVRTVTRWSQEAQEHMSHVAAEAFAGHRIVKAFGAEGREGAKFERVSSTLFRTNLKVTRVLSLLPPLMEFLGGIAIAGALWYGSREIAQGNLTAGEFTSFLAALLFMYAPIKKLSRVNANLQQAAAASERIFEVLDAHTEVLERPGAVAAAAVRRRDRIQGRHASATRTATAAARCAACRSRSAPDRWSRSSAAAAPARPRSSTCCRASTTSRAARSRSTAATSATSRSRRCARRSAS